MTLSEEVSHLANELGGEEAEGTEDDDEEVDIKINWNGLTKKIYKG